MKRFGKADATRTQSVAYGLSFRAYAIALSSSKIGQGLVSLEKRLAQRATLRERILN
ncbi:MAG: hypothetical protein F6K50_04500 [Moorea sp. SIO3I7]|uniref:hypothetical protein n=1 Tax=unclassified Moorena TaxID=2683338 RepID=UPI0013C0959B|nr:MULTISPECIES: hypothetical protein [unclassified Moorena]NEN94811.1 hypothetical protein [Moorena sp. SIO3I7]NEO08900.1 hypothetical protein [Moorena sp. SIO3I8]NEP21295.1 hypothetical protein [Moorena sp. SIO3I6]